MRIGPYEVTRLIGRGGSATVYLARSPEGAAVAVKVSSRGGARAAARFERERRLLASFGREDGFVPLLSAGEERGSLFLVMPFLEGGTLRDRLRSGTLAPDAVRLLGAVLADALGRAHALGVVHRDLKPENILFESPAPDALPLIADLGLAKHFHEEGPAVTEQLSKTGDFRGTVGYMSPEQVHDATHAAPATDVFALGVTLFECLTGVTPFEGPNLLVVIDRLEKGDRTSLTSLRPEVPQDLVRCIERATAADPAERFADGAAFAAALRALAPAASPTGSPRSGSPPSDSRVRAALLAALLALAVAGLLGVTLRTKEVVAPPPVAEKTWFELLPAGERPTLPLPDGVTPATTKGEYPHARSGATFVYVPAGPFLMGSEMPPPQIGPVHSVTLSGFFVEKLEVSNARFEAFVRATGCVTDAQRRSFSTGVNEDGSYAMKAPNLDWRDPDPGGRPRDGSHPVVHVSWNDARAFALAAGLALPTEAQWEKAALWDPVARRSARYTWGDAAPTLGSAAVANLADESARRRFARHNSILSGFEDGFEATAPVGSFPAGVSAYGALDMIGNVAEWCEDTYEKDFYQRSPALDPLNAAPDIDVHIFRGGSFFRVYAAGGYYRGYHVANYASDGLGFRCVLNPARAR